MKENIGEIIGRANHLIATGSSFTQAARKLSVEFYATAYENNGRLWVSYVDLKGMHQRGVVA